MIEFFTFCEALQPFPLGSSRGVDIGDRCYLGHSGDSAIPSLAFVRNNVFVDVSSESGDYSVLRLAERLDSELMARSFIRPFLFEPALSNGTFLVSMATVATQTCILEYSDSLIAPNWTALPPVTGDGTVKVLVDPAANPRQRYYRMVQPTAGR